MVELLDKGDSVVNHTSLSNYAFLYGVFPVAPGVAIFATQFNMEVEIVCIYYFLSLIVCMINRKMNFWNIEISILLWEFDIYKLPRCK